MRTVALLVLLVAGAALAGCLGGTDSDDDQVAFVGCQPLPEATEVPCEDDAHNQTGNGSSNGANGSGDGNGSTGNVTGNATGNGTDGGGGTGNTSENGTQTGDETVEVPRGARVGERLPDALADARAPGGDWAPWRLWDGLDQNWSAGASPNGSDHPWTLLVFYSPDCPHCWNAADDMGDWATRWRGQLQVTALAVNFSGNHAFNATRDEVAAFQDRTPHPGCLQATESCDSRPGSAHPFAHVDDRNQTLMRAWGVSSVPTAILASPDGIVVWDQATDRAGASIGTTAALDRHLLPGIGPSVGERMPSVVGQGRLAAGGDWVAFDQDRWHRSLQPDDIATNGTWLLLEFTSTDCTNCWNHVTTLEGWNARWGDRLQPVSLAETWNNGDDDATEQAEIAAWQDKVSASTQCKGSRDCADRPGSPHDWPYVADLDRSTAIEYSIQGQPMHVIVDPWGIIRWTQDAPGGETTEAALERLLGDV